MFKLKELQIEIEGRKALTMTQRRAVERAVKNEWWVQKDYAVAERIGKMVGLDAKSYQQYQVERDSIIRRLRYAAKQSSPQWDPYANRPARIKRMIGREIAAWNRTESFCPLDRPEFSDKINQLEAKGRHQWHERTTSG